MIPTSKSQISLLPNENSTSTATAGGLNKHDNNYAQASAFVETPKSKLDETYIIDSSTTTSTAGSLNKHGNNYAQASAFVETPTTTNKMRPISKSQISSLPLPNKNSTSTATAGGLNKHAHIGVPNSQITIIPNKSGNQHLTEKDESMVIKYKSRMNFTSSTPAISSKSKIKTPLIDVSVIGTGNVETACQHMLFADKTICFAGFEDDDEVKQLKQAIKSCGGYVVDDGEDTISNYALYNICTSKIIKTTTPATLYWVRQSMIEDELLPLTANLFYQPIPTFKKFKHALNGCVVTISGYESSERNAISNLSREAGAVVQDKLSKGRSDGSKPTTHLVLKASSGSKYNTAKEWKVSAVSLEWLIDSIVNGKKADEKNYSIESFDELQQKEFKQNLDRIRRYGVDQGGIPTSIIDLTGHFENMSMKKSSIHYEHETSLKETSITPLIDATIVDTSAVQYDQQQQNNTLAKMVRCGKSVHIIFPNTSVGSSSNIELTFSNTTNNHVRWESVSTEPVYIESSNELFSRTIEQGLHITTQQSTLIKSKYSIFNIIPESGIIPPSQKQIIKIEFNPREACGLLTQHWHIATEDLSFDLENKFNDLLNCELVLHGTATNVF